MTCVLLAISAAYLGFSRPNRWRHAAAMMVGVTAAVLLYLVTTVDVGGPQFFGAISPLFLWSVAIGSSVVLTVPVVVIGIAAGGILRALSSRRVSAHRV